MHFVGRLDKVLYSCITNDIIADEVVITDERIRHIQERHPNDYERFSSYLPCIISEPDYIIQDERPYTAMVLKEFTDNDATECFRLALRLITSADNGEFKNSVLTFMKIRKREYERLVRNKKVLYKRE